MCNHLHQGSIGFIAGQTSNLAGAETIASPHLFQLRQVSVKLRVQRSQFIKEWPVALQCTHEDVGKWIVQQQAIVQGLHMVHNLA